MPRTELPESMVALMRDIGADAAGTALFFRSGVPLLALPQNREVAFATAGLYLPQSAKGKIAAFALRCLCRTGLHYRVLPRIPGNSGYCGSLFCNPAHGTRIVAVKRTENGELRVIKAATPECASPLVSEHEALNRFSNYLGVPKVGPLRQEAGSVSFDIPYLQSAPRDADPSALLTAWDSGTTECATDNGLIRSLLPYLNSAEREKLTKIHVRRAIVHGDFAPWNWRAAPDGSGIVCIDWEWARNDGFAGFDLAYCLVQTELLVRHTPRENILSAISATVSALPASLRQILGGCGLPLELLVTLVLAYRESKGQHHE